MATGVTSQKIASTHAIESYDHDPGGTGAVVTSPDGGTTPRYVAMRDYEFFGVQARPTVVGGNGITLLEIVGASMGLKRDDNYKRLKIMNDADAIAADCHDLMEQHGLDPATTRQAIMAMLEEQPLPVRG